MSCFQRDTELGKRYKRTEFEKRDTNAKGNIHLWFQFFIVLIP